MLVAVAATRLGELCAELGEGLLDDGLPETAVPHFAEARALAEEALQLLPPEAPGRRRRADRARLGAGRPGRARRRDRAAARRRPHHLRRRRPRPAGRRAAGARPDAAPPGRRRRAPTSTWSPRSHLATEHGLPRLRRAALRELCTLHAELDDAGRALPYLQAYLADELDRVDERRTRWVELFGRRKSLLETERAAGQLRRQAYEDPLTHLPNRRYAEARLDGLLAGGGVPALAVVDVDRFKSINDAIGHPGGDAVLRAVSELLIAGVRDTDEVCRWAGDEFVVLLPDTTAEQAERALERTRRKVAGYDWASLGPEPPVTISVGIASAARGDDRRTLFAAADGVLYDAKRSGRDRVVRLSGVTQKRAGGSPLDVLFGGSRDRGPATPRPPDDAAPGGRAPAAEVPALPPAPARAAAASLAPADPPLGVDRPGRAAPAARVPGAGARRRDPVPAVPRGRPSPRSSGRPGAPPSRCWRWSARRAASTPTARRWCCGRAPRPSSPLAAEHDAYTTMDAAAMAAAVGPLPEPVGRVARDLRRRRRHPGGRRGRVRRPGHGQRGRAARRRRRQPGPRAAGRPRAAPTPTAWSWWPGWTPRWWRPWAR